MIPINHFRHLKRLADLRRCSIAEAIAFVVEHIDPVSENWIDKHFGTNDEVRTIDLGGYTLNLIMEKIQGLPRNIRPVTDGPYLNEFSFFYDEQGLMGIEAEGLRMLDFEMATSRDIDVLALVCDLLPQMTPQQYRIYNTFNSQYLRLVREPKLFHMPRKRAMAIDVGCYVGYKALALAQFTGGAPVLALELASDNLAVLQKNIANNPHLKVKGVRAALSDKREDSAIYTRNERTMAHSLTSFKKLKEANTVLTTAHTESIGHEIIRTTLLDDYTTDIRELSAVHISVNGHEPEVVGGATETAKKADILRVSCPYSLDGRPIRDMVIERFCALNMDVFGISGAAVIAGRELGDYHAVPIIK